MTTGKTIALMTQTFVGKVTYALFNMLPRVVIAFLLWSKHLLILWLQSLSEMILWPKKAKSVTVSAFSLSICLEVMGLVAMILGFWMLNFKPDFHSSILPSSRGFLFPFCFLPFEWYYLHIWGCWHFSWQSWFQLVIHSAWHFTWHTLHRS